MKDFDRRIHKTKQVIEDALFNLMQEKSYNKITIQDIIDRANVGRSTFYSHYETKDDLLLNCIEPMLKVLDGYILDYLGKDEDNKGILSIAELFDHIRENSKLMRGLMKAENSDMFFGKVQTFWNSKIEKYLMEKVPKGTEPKVPVMIIANHISGTFLQLLKWWINNKMPYTTFQMDQYFKELVNPCIDLIIEKK